MSIKLDLKNFKYKSSDGKTTTLQHAKDGHVITLTHAALSPSGRDQLSALSKTAAEAETPLQADEEKHQKKAMAEGGKIEQYYQDQLKKEPVKEPKKEPQPHQPPKSTTKYDDKPSDRFGDIKHKLAKGGEIEDAPHEGATASSPASRLDSGFGRVIMRAEGGEVDHEHEGAKFCMHCGGEMPTMAAEGFPTPEDASAQPPRSEDPDIAEQQQADVANKQAVDADMSAAKTAYNQKLAASGNVVGQDDFFGPNGEPPKNPVNPALWMATKNSTATEKMANQEISGRQAISKANDAVRTQQAEHEKAVAQNAVNKELGLPLVADPGAPQIPDQAKQEAGLVQQQSQPQMQIPPTSMPGAQQQGDGGFGGMSPLAMTDEAYHRMNSALGKKAEIEGKVATEQAGHMADQQAHLEAAQKTYQEQYNRVTQELSDHIDDIKHSYIDPDQYWNGHTDPQTGEKVGGHSKLMAGIGMILAGFNPSTSPNAAVNLLKFNIEQNVQAQAHNLNSKHNLVNAYMNEFGNIKDAMNMARLNLAEITKLKLDQAAAKNGGQMAVQNANLAKGQLEMEYGPRRQQIAINQAMMKMMSGPGGMTPQMLGVLRVTHPEMAKEMEGRIAPGNLGISPYRQIEKTDADKMEAYQNTLRQLHEALNFKQTHPAASMSIQDRRAASTMMANLGNQVRVAEDMGVFKKSEADMMKSMLGSSPASFFSKFNSDPHLREMLRLKHGEFGTLLNKYNLPLPKDLPSPNQRPDGTIATNPKTGQQMVFKGDKWYNTD